MYANSTKYYSNIMTCTYWTNNNVSLVDVIKVSDVSDMSESNVVIREHFSTIRNVILEFLLRELKQIELSSEHLRVQGYYNGNLYEAVERGLFPLNWCFSREKDAILVMPILSLIKPCNWFGYTIRVTCKEKERGF